MLAGRVNAIPCGRRLAGDEAREPCIARSAAIAGKPAPTGPCFSRRIFIRGQAACKGIKA
ncbi:hypothetical protein C3F00_014065 [Pseudomonas sp. MWU13-2860]|nr:hypothetical protein C3F00_014065 [Pseudomonas sp. MWU13-2860]